MKRIKIIKRIRKLLQEKNPHWRVIEAWCEEAELKDTAFRDKLYNRNVEGLLKDYLLK